MSGENVRCGRMLQSPIDGSFIATGWTSVRRLRQSARQARVVTLLVNQERCFRFQALKHCRAIATSRPEISRRSQVECHRQSIVGHKPQEAYSSVPDLYSIQKYQHAILKGVASVYFRCARLSETSDDRHLPQREPAFIGPRKCNRGPCCPVQGRRSHLSGKSSDGEAAPSFITPNKA